MAGVSDDFPRQYARTRRFTAGVPRQFTVSPDGERVVFCRSGSGADPTQSLWVLDVATGVERRIADPATLIRVDADVPAEERARRERARDRATGITTYATDRAGRVAAFGLSGRVWLVDLEYGGPRELAAAGPVVDPRPNPSGDSVAYVSRGSLRVIAADGRDDRPLAEPEDADVTYGLAEFVAAEEMGRRRGHWWSPDGDQVLVARVDERDVTRVHIADPADPARPPTAVRYPLAGTANAQVTLWLLGLDGSRVPVGWDRAGFEYVVTVLWDRAGLLVVVQNRAQTTTRVLAVDSATGDTTVVREDRDSAWVPVVPGVPDFTADGMLVWAAEANETDTRHLMVDGRRVTPAGLQVREVLDVDGDAVLLAASEEPTETHVWRWSATAGLIRLSRTPGVHRGRSGGGTVVMVSEALDAPGVRVTARTSTHGQVAIASNAETPVLVPRVEILRAGEHALRTAVVLPTGHVPGSAKLPVLLDPYGGPAAQRVVAASSAYLVPQWFADQGFAVVVADGRGTPGRGPAWDRAIHLDKAEVALEDQVAALNAAAELYPDLDLSRVAIRGWSYGGYLAALAVLRRPDVFHAAVAGAPVTDQRLYDTHYQERYLGHPDENPQVYDQCSLIADAPGLRRPFMLVHGLADDNVFAAHTLRLSAALTAAGRPHTVLPLVRATHMADDEAVTANLLVLQAHFLLNALEGDRPGEPR